MYNAWYIGEIFLKNIVVNKYFNIIRYDRTAADNARKAVPATLRAAEDKMIAKIQEMLRHQAVVQHSAEGSEVDGRGHDEHKLHLSAHFNETLDGTYPIVVCR